MEQWRQHMVRGETRCRREEEYLSDITNFLCNLLLELGELIRLDFLLLLWHTVIIDDLEALHHHVHPAAAPVNNSQEVLGGLFNSNSIASGTDSPS